MKILIASDAWYPQINGVVRTIDATVRELGRRGHQLRILNPEGRRTLPCPSYPEIRLSIAPGRSVNEEIDRFAPDAIHIATEGPLGVATRRYCLRRGFAFTTSFHTRFPEYVHARWRVPLATSYTWLRWFHAPARAVMVATPTVQGELIARGFERTVLWSRGVDVEAFHPNGARAPLGTAGPIFMAVGRVAVEKNLVAFLELKLGEISAWAAQGSKWVVGDGPQLGALRAAYPEVHFAGAQTTALADYYRAADVLVFPSRTDTFGLVMIEAMACGTPVAAYPVPGPLDVVGTSSGGALDENLARACRKALRRRREEARSRAEVFSWTRATDQFLHHLVPCTSGTRTPAAALAAQ